MDAVLHSLTTFFISLVMLYLIIINVVGFVLMHNDKRRAVKGQWRIPEATLMGVAAVGGSAGALLGMYTFRHKTKHPKFYLGIPAILFLQLCLLALICF